MCATTRQARHADAKAMLAIYRPFIEHTTVSFETEVPSEQEFAQRIDAAQSEHEWLVAEMGSAVIGYAYGSKHRSRGAYRTSCEVSAYVADSAQGRGVARLLYERLFERLVELGYCNALAGIAGPNDKSAAFHAAMGFTLVGVYHHIGFKNGAWHDVAWYERILREGPPGDV
ncbi:MAG: L-amino acid N-acyltransferase YncA [Planctomycetota bacterium]|jgi:L-amino acid N-acyltransferase YncA